MCIPLASCFPARSTPFRAVKMYFRPNGSEDLLCSHQTGSALHAKRTYGRHVWEKVTICRYYFWFHIFPPLASEGVCKRRVRMGERSVCQKILESCSVPKSVVPTILVHPCKLFVNMQGCDMYKSLFHNSFFIFTSCRTRVCGAMFGRGAHEAGTGTGKEFATSVAGTRQRVRETAIWGNQEEQARVAPPGFPLLCLLL